MKEKLLLLFSKFTWLDWALVLVFLVSCVYLAFFGWSRLHQRIVPVEYLAANEAVSPDTIWVDVGGAVSNPGVYQLSADARVKDALVAAGGVTEEADRTYFSKLINLAARLKDGEKLYIPFVAEKSGKAVLGETSTLININSASDQELDGLPGIGPARAGEIIRNRPYKTTDELVSKKIVSASVFEQIRDKIAVY